MGAAEALQQILAAVAKAKLAGAVDERLRQLGDEDLAAVRLPGHARGYEDRPAEIPILLRDDVARVQPDPDANIRQPRLARGQILLDRHGAADRPPGAR